jgi:hypothetical protein
MRIKTNNGRFRASHIRKSSWKNYSQSLTQSFTWSDASLSVRPFPLLLLPLASLVNNPMNIINHILSLPVSPDTINLAYICAALVAVRVGLSVILHNLSR